MATEVDWNSLGGTERSGGGSGRGRTNYLRFSSGKTTVFRPVGKAVEFGKFFIPKGTMGISENRNVIVEKDDLEAAQSMLSAHAGTELVGSHKFAINVIDRDDGKIKILEQGPSVFKFFANWAKANNSHPGGQGGGDWSISAEGEKMKRRYTTGFIRPAPLSQEELKRIRDGKEIYTLKEIYKSVALDKVIERAFGQRDSRESGPDDDSVPQSTPHRQTVAAAVSSSNVNVDTDELDDDPINW